MFLCSHCDFSNSPRFCEVIQHSTETHPDINLQCRGERLKESTGKLEHTLFNFSAIPSDVITNYTIIRIEKSNTIVLQSRSNPAKVPEVDEHLPPSDCPVDIIDGTLYIEEVITKAKESHDLLEKTYRTSKIL